MVEDEQKARDDARESQAKAERNANKLSTELEELRAQLEQVSCLCPIFDTNSHVRKIVISTDSL